MNENGLLLLFILAWYYLSWNSCDLSGFYKHLVLSKNEVAFLCVVLFGTWLYFVVKRTKQKKFSSFIIITITIKPQVSRTCLTIFAVPSNVAFCKSSLLLFTSNFVSQTSNFFDVIARAPITT